MSNLPDGLSPARYDELQDEGWWDGQEPLYDPLEISGIYTFWVPGKPVALGRPRTRVVGKRAMIYNPPLSMGWQKEAAKALRVQRDFIGRLGEQGLGASPLFATAPVWVCLDFYYPLQKSRHRKNSPVPSRPRLARPDLDNLVKNALDAATGVLWADDAQVVSLTATKNDAAQGEEPGVRYTVRRHDA